MESPDYRNASRGLGIIQGVKYGAIAGFIATWSISTAIAASELELGLPVSTFYSIMGISLGSSDFAAAAYLGFGLHLATGTLLGSIFGVVAVKAGPRKFIFDPYRATLTGIGTGILVWLVLFLPVTALFVQPSIDRIVQILPQENGLPVLDSSNNAGESFRGIAISAIAFHVMWGAIFGFIISSLVRIRASSAFMPQQYQFAGPHLKKVALFGLAAGLISSLAVSGMILLVEKISALPVGTFYYVVVSALTNSYSGDPFAVVALGLAMHLLAGSLMGLVMSVPFMMLKNNSGSKRTSSIQKYGPVYGLAFGFGLWLAVFMPITLMMVAPFLNSFENQDVMVRQSVPSGGVASVTFFGLLSMMDRIIYGAIAFHMFYGLLTAILLQSFSEKYPAAGKRRERQAGLVGRGG